MFLDNKLRRHRAGYEVVTPLRVDGEHVLVNRGWIEAGRTRDALPRGAHAGRRRCASRASRWSACRACMQLERGRRGKVRQNLDLGAVRGADRAALQPYFLEQHRPPTTACCATGRAPDAGVEKHESYSLQWYSFAALAVVLFIVLSFRRVAQSLSSRCIGAGLRRAVRAGHARPICFDWAPGSAGELRRAARAARRCRARRSTRCAASGCW